MKKILTSLLTFTCLLAVAMGALAQSNSAADWQSNYLNGIQEQLSLPPATLAFIAFKEQQANDIARKNGFELDPDFKSFFAAAKAGRAREAEQWLLTINKNSYGTNLTPSLKGPLRPVAVDAALAYEPFNDADADLVLALGRDLMSSLPASCIYFGGTDVGRGLPTMLCSAPGEPIFVLSQNPLSDGRYRQYLREMYGTRIKLPDTNEVQQIVDAFTSDLQRRSEHDAKFPGEPKQLKPGENVRLAEGKPRMDGFIAIMECNALVMKNIFDKNPEREFFYEESSALEWLYPRLSPHGAVMKINRTPLDVISADDLKADAEYWKRQVAAKLGDWLTADLPLADICARLQGIYARHDLSNFKGDARFLHSESVHAAYAHLRNSIATVYDWRLKTSTSAAEKQLLGPHAEMAHRQAFALCPYQLEAVYGYVSFCTQFNQMDDALLVAKTAAACAPKSDTQRFAQLIDNLEKMKARRTGSPAKPDPQSQLKQLKADFDAGKIDKATYEQKKSTIMNSL